jgi:AcrR family transcriptional regulator
MGSPDPQVRRTRGRPRTPGAEERILDAALEEYGERGWSGFTMDAVARRAGCGKSTVYLRWKDKDSLLTDAVRMRTLGIDDVDTGSFRGDLEALAANLFHHYLDPAGWATLRITVDSAGSSTPLGEFAEVVRDLHKEGLDAIAQRAIARGEVLEDFPQAALVECIYGAVTIQTLTLTGASRHLTDEEIGERARTLVDFVLHGALAGSPGRDAAVAG